MIDDISDDEEEDIVNLIYSVLSEAKTSEMDDRKYSIQIFSMTIFCINLLQLSLVCHLSPST